MSLLIYGIVLFILLHIIPVFALEIRQKWINKVGAEPYRVIFGSLVLGSVIIIVYGFNIEEREIYYIPLSFSAHITYIFVFIAFLSIVLGFLNKLLNGKILTGYLLGGVIFWAIGHLISNGDSASVTLFATTIIWALFMLMAIKLRDGYIKPANIVIWHSLPKALIIALIAFVVIGYLHQFVIGVVALNFYPFI